MGGTWYLCQRVGGGVIWRRQQHAASISNTQWYNGRALVYGGGKWVLLEITLLLDGFYERSSSIQVRYSNAKQLKERR